MIAAAMTRTRRLLDRLLGDDLARKLARGGFAALVIKVCAAGLSFLMFLVLARAMSAEDFGRFGFGFSLATLLAVAGSFGQRMLVLRFAPVYDHDGDRQKLAGVVRDGYRLVALGCGLLGLATLATGLFWPGLAARGYLVAAGVFTLVLGLAEYQAHVLRAFGGMLLSLGPRDILWRAGVILLALGAALGLLPKLDAAGGLWLTAGVLAAVVAGQALAHPVTRPAALFAAPADTSDRPTWRHAMWGLWASSFIRTAAPNLAVVVLGLVLTPEATGPFFAALRLSMLLNLFLMAANMIAAPMIARTYHRGDRDDLQRLCAHVSVGLTLPTLAVFLVFVLAGDRLLELFGTGYAAYYWVLIVLSVGYLVNALSGSTSQLMEMTGDERYYLRIVTVVNGIAIAALAPLSLLLGPLGAAIALTFSQCAWNGSCILRSRSRCKVDPSILSLLYKP